MLIESLGTSLAPFSLSSHLVKRSEIAPAEREKWETWVGLRMKGSLGLKFFTRPDPTQISLIFSFLCYYRAVCYRVLRCKLSARNRLLSNVNVLYWQEPFFFFSVTDEGGGEGEESGADKYEDDEFEESPDKEEGNKEESDAKQDTDKDEKDDKDGKDDEEYNEDFESDGEKEKSKSESEGEEDEDSEKEDDEPEDDIQDETEEKQATDTGKQEDDAEEIEDETDKENNHVSVKH